jgi:8-oxo-dGTP pyrophosphatase MutT (NUDIX family)
MQFTDRQIESERQHDYPESGAWLPEPQVETEPALAGAIVWCDGFVVLRRTKNGNWLFPKGHVEAFESPPEAAVREVEEETGLQVDLLGPLGYVEVQKRKSRIGLLMYACRARARGAAWAWHFGRDTFLVHPSAVASMLSFPELRRFWAEYLEYPHAAASA